ncbi:hypothetical protein SADUNF_Sadunf14G0101400 [Salix dunnii]|uniref:Shikimate dehydrogenase n=1 Tax=Salix dunnii TaxID=1413687 RepID=A0A835JIP6_9ROSI|nr:hypothetical protein SADUNF_Sadunf14G0101400 [Salix dunnii]
MAFKNNLSVCTPLECETAGEMLSSMKRAEAEGADLAELRLDSLSFSHHSEVEKLIKHRTLPSIVSFRLKPSSISSNRDRKNTCLQVLRLAFDLNVEFVEMDYEVASEDVMAEYVYNRSNTKLIVSSYVNGRKPSAEELGYLIACMQSTGADVLKLVLDVEKITDLAPVFTMLSHCQVPLIALAVGSRGLISQLLGPKFGGFLVYGSLSDKAVPGMPSLLSLRQVYKLEYINADTKVFGLISNPVGHSKGPILHNPAFRHTGYNGIYVPMQVDDVKEFFRTYTSSDFAVLESRIRKRQWGAVMKSIHLLRVTDEVYGITVSSYYQQSRTLELWDYNSFILHFLCDVLHLSFLTVEIFVAQSIGAVNTIVRRPTDGKLVGYNTDCDASISAIEDALTERRITQKGVLEASPLSGKTFVLIGAGGAGRALAFGAKSRGARVIIFNRDYEERARALAKAVSGEALPYESLDKFRPENGMILANASAIGMEPNPDRSPVSKEALKAYELVFDAVYTPRNTRLLQEAKEVGAVVVSGVEMFIRQALGQFRLFTGGLGINLPAVSTHQLPLNDQLTEKFPENYLNLSSKLLLPLLCSSGGIHAQASLGAILIVYPTILSKISVNVSFFKAIRNKTVMIIVSFPSWVEIEAPERLQLELLTERPCFYPESPKAKRIQKLCFSDSRNKKMKLHNLKAFCQAMYVHNIDAASSYVLYRSTE